MLRVTLIGIGGDVRACFISTWRPVCWYYSLVTHGEYSGPDLLVQCWNSVWSIISIGSFAVAQRLLASSDLVHFLRSIMDLASVLVCSAGGWCLTNAMIRCTSHHRILRSACLWPATD